MTKTTSAIISAICVLTGVIIWQVLTIIDIENKIKVCDESIVVAQKANEGLIDAGFQLMTAAEMADDVLQDAELSCNMLRSYR